MSNIATRSQPIPEDPFPPIERFQHKAKLPTYKSIIGVIRYVWKVYCDHKKKMYSVISVKNPISEISITREQN